MSLALSHELSSSHSEAAVEPWRSSSLDSGSPPYASMAPRAYALLNSNPQKASPRPSDDLADTAESVLSRISSRLSLLPDEMASHMDDSSGVSFHSASAEAVPSAPPARHIASRRRAAMEDRWGAGCRSARPWAGGAARP